MQEEQPDASSQGRHPVSRRGFLAYGMLAAASAIILPHERAFAAADTFFSAERSLSFCNLHTGEELTSVYWRKGKYQSAALTDINYILRDYRTGDIKKIDTALLDLLHILHKKVGASDPFHVISGYRSPRTKPTRTLSTR